MSTNAQSQISSDRSNPKSCLTTNNSSQKAQKTIAATVQALDPLSYGLSPICDTAGPSSGAFRKPQLQSKTKKTSASVIAHDKPRNPLTHEERLLALRKITSSASSMASEDKVDKCVSSTSHPTFVAKARRAMSNLISKPSGSKQ